MEVSRFCELKKDGVLRCMCQNLGRGIVNGHKSITHSSVYAENKKCHYKMWKREQKKNEA